MNPVKGAGAILLALAAIAALTRVKDVAHLILLASVTIVALCMVTLIVSGLRRHHDRLAALGRIAAAAEVSGGGAGGAGAAAGAAGAASAAAAATVAPGPAEVAGLAAVGGPVEMAGLAAVGGPAQDDPALWRPYAS